jgi:hypothetical protein
MLSLIWLIVYFPSLIDEMLKEWVQENEKVRRNKRKCEYDLHVHYG